MNQEEVRKLFAERQAIVTGSHFVYTSGKHGANYVNKDRVIPFVTQLFELCRMIALQFDGYLIEAVVAPALGGIALSQWVAYHLSILTGREVIAVYAEKEEVVGSAFYYLMFALRLLLGAWVPQWGRAPSTRLVFKRGHGELVAGKRTLTVEDILNTGGSLLEVNQLVKSSGGHLLGSAALCNRGQVTASKAGTPELVSLLELDFMMESADNCSLCVAGVPISTELGHGKKFLEGKKIGG